MKKNKFLIFKNIMTILTIVLFITSLGIVTIISLNKKVEIVYFNTPVIVNTLSSTVREVLVENNIYVNNDMEISCDLDQEIKENMSITINSSKQYEGISTEKLENELKLVSTKISLKEISIPFNEKKVENSKVAKGIKTVKKEGKNGTNNEVYFVKKLASNEVKFKVDEVEITKPVDKVVEVGTSKVISVASTSSNITIPAVDSGFKKYNISLSADKQQYAYYLANKYGFDYELFLTLMFKESGFRASAIGGGNSYGMCQIHYSNFSKLSKVLGINNFLDPFQNMQAGAYMLNLYMNSAKKIFKDTASIEVYALNSYNMGEGSYYAKCYSQGIFHRSYSNAIIKMRNSLVANGYF